MYDELKRKFKNIIADSSLYVKPVKVKSKVLSDKEALGEPIHNDYPLLKGKESLVQADFMGAKGVAFTDMYDHYEGTLSEILGLPLTNNFQRAILISTINAVLKKLGLIDNTEHCRNDGLIKCANHLKDYMNDNYPDCNILLVGFQPRFADILTENFRARIVDLNCDNIGKQINGITIDSEDKTNELIKWADLLFVTSSTFVNGTAENFIIPGEKTIFYGVSGAGPTYLLGLERYCHQ